MDEKSLLSRLSSDSEQSVISSSKQIQQKSLRRRNILVACSFLATLSCAGIFVFLFWTPYSWRSSPLAAPATPAPLNPWDPRTSLNGPPTAQFRDNLKPDVQYITSWPGAGWTNDVMTYINLIYLGFITDRVPVLPMFVPSHIVLGATAPVPAVPFGDVFDWREVKDIGSDAVDDIGYNDHFPHDYHIPYDVSTPGRLKLAKTAFPDVLHNKQFTANPLASRLNGVTLPPDEQMLCYDYLYYVCALEPYEYDKDYSPAWRYLANLYLNRAFGLPELGPTPPYIAIHVRHYDFAGWCGDVPLNDCFASIPIIARRVREVQEKIRIEKGITVDHIVMTSDETDQECTPDHTHTKEILGLGTYPVLIDAAIQSGGVGFVGTDRSTMSIIAMKRAQAWQGAVTRLVKWGHVGADDEE
ncbi:hypothetical protein BDP27DRAFT_1316061 [Rhodocollybia butyracea]|uniref:Uncharacterized protein n=1 Tax=Rhodocollybia butyracea TaxID=206335 RepID=A0A9P5Q4X6_9AGAR|nr:hypothetical protein BDP27DRAFT_1316061 [Rhodocollybia butyracea]